MHYKITYRQNVEKDLKKLPLDIAKRAFDLIESIISKGPFVGIQLKGKFKQLWRHRFGDYRIVYAVNTQNKSILILRIRHRKNAYYNLTFP